MSDLIANVALERLYVHEGDVCNKRRGRLIRSQNRVIRNRNEVVHK